MSGNDQDAFRKVGRGGAGNFYPVKDEDLAAAEKNLVLERQDDKSNPIVEIADPSSQASGIRAGRGGAGNLIDPSQVPGAQEKERMSREVTEAVTSSLKKHPRRMGGRGGAGNWDGEEQRDDAGVEEEQDVCKAEKLERKVMEAVEKGLKMPEKVYHGREKDVRQ